jgi:hypothetical protein
MNIRKPLHNGKNTACRTCREEVRSRFFSSNEIHTNSYYAFGGRYEIDRAAFEKELDILNKNNAGNLWVLEGRTASGSGNEVICKKHLNELIDNIRTAIGDSAPIEKINNKKTLARYHNVYNINNHRYPNSKGQTIGYAITKRW